MHVQRHGLGQLVAGGEGQGCPSSPGEELQMAPGDLKMQILLLQLWGGTQVSAFLTGAQVSQMLWSRSGLSVWA